MFLDGLTSSLLVVLHNGPEEYAPLTIPHMLIVTSTLGKTECVYNFVPVTFDEIAPIGYNLSANGTLGNSVM